MVLFGFYYRKLPADKYLKSQRWLYVHCNFSFRRLHPDAEALILAQAFGRGNSHHDGGVDFGGGSSGGGSATGSLTNPA